MMRLNEALLQPKTPPPFALLLLAEKEERAGFRRRASLAHVDDERILSFSSVDYEHDESVSMKGE